jgi:hypothetical protein
MKETLARRAQTAATVAAIAAALLAAAPTGAAPAAQAAKPQCSPAAPALGGEAAAARNVATVRAVYAAFAAGDVPAILGCVADGAAWEAWSDNHGQRANVPWLKAGTGREGAARFFAYVGKWKINAFAVKNVMGAGENVAAEIEADFDVTQTGGRLRDEEMHYWTFDAHGMIVRFRHYADTAKHIAAANGER